jgi:hypothetical protein
MTERALLAVATATKSEAGVIEHRIINCNPDELVKLLTAAKSDTERNAVMREHGSFGYALSKKKIICAPEGRTPEDLYIVAHECAHVALKHDHRKPLYIREYEAEMWAHEARGNCRGDG